MINPYATGFPADPKSFAGRGGELREIKKAIDYTGNIAKRCNCRGLGLAKLRSCIS
jgi:hypothetical protein